MNDAGRGTFWGNGLAVAGACIIVMAAAGTGWAEGQPTVTRLEYLKGVVEKAGPYEDTSSEQAALEAKYAAVIGLAVLGETDIVAETASDSAQDPILRLVAACSLGRLGEEDRGFPLALSALARVLERAREQDADGAATPDHPGTLFDYAATSFRSHDLSPAIADAACDASIPPRWRMCAGLAVGLGSSGWEGLIARVVSTRYSGEDTRTAQNDREARARLCGMSVQVGRGSPEAETIAVESVAFLNEDAKWFVYKTLEYATLNAESVAFLRHRLGKGRVTDEIEKAIIAGILRTHSAERDEELENVIRNSFSRQAGVVLGYVPMDKRLGLDLVKEAVASDDFNVRAAGYRKAGELMRRGKCTFADIREFLDKASVESLYVPLPWDLVDTARAEEAPEVIRFLLGSGNAGLQQTGILMTMRYTPDKNSDLLKGFVDSGGGRDQGSMVLPLALHALAGASDSATAKEEAVKLDAGPYLYYIKSGTIRVICANGEFTGQEKLISTFAWRLPRTAWANAKFPHEPVLFDFSMHHFFPYAPYYDFRQMMVWETSLAMGLVESAMSRAAAKTSADASSQVGQGGASKSPSPQTVLAQQDVSALGDYDRTCYELMRLCMEKDPTQCTARLERVAPFPLLAWDDMGKLTAAHLLLQRSAIETGR